jgi:hypothetical protein
MEAKQTKRILQQLTRLNDEFMPSELGVSIDEAAAALATLRAPSKKEQPDLNK